MLGSLNIGVLSQFTYKVAQPFIIISILRITNLLRSVLRLMMEQGCKPGLPESSLVLVVVYVSFVITFTI